MGGWMQLQLLGSPTRNRNGSGAIAPRRSHFSLHQELRLTRHRRERVRRSPSRGAKRSPGHRPDGLARPHVISETGPSVGGTPPHPRASAPHEHLRVRAPALSRRRRRAKFVRSPRRTRGSKLGARNRFQATEERSDSVLGTTGENYRIRRGATGHAQGRHRTCANPGQPP